jgi:hypothetical protein
MYVCNFPDQILANKFQVLGVIMAATFSVVGFYFGRNPTSKTRFGEEQVNIAENSSPWTISSDQIENNDKNNFKYMYHPRGDYRNAPRKAPSALNSVIVPNVTLPKVSGPIGDGGIGWLADNGTELA